MLMIATVPSSRTKVVTRVVFAVPGAIASRSACCTMRSSMSTSPFASSSAWNADQSVTSDAS